MSAAERRARYLAKPGNREKEAARKKRKAGVEKALSLIDKHSAIDISGVTEYRRGLRHGLQAGRAMAYNFNGGRSWGFGELAGQFSPLIEDIPAAVVVIGDALVDDELPCSVDIVEKFWEPRRAH